MKIGFFDSGIGGTTVLRWAMHDLPQYEYMYYADNAHMPYGDKSPDELYKLTTDALREMFDNECKLVILACNTATTVLPRIQQEWLPRHFPDRRVLGIIRPTIEHMIASGKKKIYLLATEATVKADSYSHELKKLGSDIELIEIACPELASAIEKEDDLQKSPTISNLLREYLSLVPDPGQTIYTGCTHYELVRDMIYQISGIKAFTQGYLGAKSMVAYLKKHNELILTSSESDNQRSPLVISTEKSKEYVEKVLRQLYE
ncbi:MAG: glutamate racemase [Candidatus Roizmanbacteria bacterium]